MDNTMEMENLQSMNRLKSDESIKIVPDYRNQASSTGLVCPVKDDDAIAKFQLSFKRNLWILAFVISSLLYASCIIPYIISVNEGLVHPIFPYVSDAGASHPAAAFFSLMQISYLFLMMIFFWARYKNIDYYLNGLIATSPNKLAGTENLERLSRINFYSLIPACLLIFGNIMIISFRSTEYFKLHLLGASLLSGAGFYFFMQIYLCNKLYEFGQIESRPTTMMIIYVISILSLASTAVFTILSLSQQDTSIEWTGQTRLLWSPDMAGYHFHVLATFSEWIAILSGAVLLMCLGKRMRSFKYWEHISF